MSTILLSCESDMVGYTEIPVGIKIIYYPSHEIQWLPFCSRHSCFWPPIVGRHFATSKSFQLSRTWPTCRYRIPMYFIPAFRNSCMLAVWQISVSGHRPTFFKLKVLSNESDMNKYVKYSIAYLFAISISVTWNAEISIHASLSKTWPRMSGTSRWNSENTTRLISNLLCFLANITAFWRSRTSRLSSVIRANSTVSKQTEHFRIFLL